MPVATMHYATQQDLIDRFGERELIQLTDPDGAAIAETRVERALLDAHALADGKLSRVYAVPLDGCRKPAPQPGNVHAVEQVPPPQLVRIVCDVARYYLYDDLAPESEVVARYKQAVAELDAIAAGKAQLVCPWGGEPGRLLATGALGDGEVLFEFSPRKVTDAAAGGYR